MSIYQFKGGMGNSNLERFGRFGLFIFYFLVCLYYVCYVFACFFSHFFIFAVAASEREGWVLSFCCIVSFRFLFFFLFFTFIEKKVILSACGVRGLFSVGQSVTYISILEAHIKFGGGWQGLSISKKSFIIVCISNIFLLIFCIFYMFFRFVLVYVLACVWLFVHKCVVVQLSVSYENLNICFKEASKRWGLTAF